MTVKVKLAGQTKIVNIHYHNNYDQFSCTFSEHYVEQNRTASVR